MAGSNNSIAQARHEKPSADFIRPVTALRAGSQGSKVEPLSDPSSGIPGPQFIGNFKLNNGAHVFIEKGGAQNYASMRANQLKALLNLEFLASDCRHSTITKDTADNFRWLAASLAGELSDLIDIVDADAREEAHANGGAKC